MNRWAVNRWIAIGVLLNACFLATQWMREGADAAPAAGEPRSTRNGDVNGDGAIDVSDAVYILQGLFVGGPAPTPIECPSTVQAPRLPVSGQTRCFDGKGNPIECNSFEYPGQDAAYKAGCPAEGRFQDNGDGTVTDNCCGLVWQKESAPGKLTWQEALKYSEGLVLGGQSDWRLPNIRELATLVDHGRYSPAIDPIFGSASDWYWSSSTSIHYPAFAWMVNFRDGHDLADDTKLRPYYVRAVRSLTK